MRYRRKEISDNLTLMRPAQACNHGRLWNHLEWASRSSVLSLLRRADLPSPLRLSDPPSRIFSDLLLQCPALALGLSAGLDVEVPFGN